MAEDDDYEEQRGRWRRVLMVAITVAVVLGAGWVIARPALTRQDAEPFIVPSSDTTGTTTGTTETTSDAATATPPRSTTERVAATTGTRRPVDTSTAATTTGAGGDTTPPGIVTTTDDPPPTTAPPPTDEPAPTTAPPPPPTTTTTTSIAATYDTTPDGLPAPVIAFFDVAQITLEGAVPDQAASDRLAALALANSKTEAIVINDLTLNEAVPRSVGVRVVELTSSRFPDGSATVLPDHALELDRAVTIMNAFPNITATVVGHADQRGDAAVNYDLSVERARSVVSYMVSRGISAPRLASRAVGEDELLSFGDDATALALNRRTEFIFYGLLVG